MSVSMVMNFKGKIQPNVKLFIFKIVNTFVH